MLRLVRLVRLNGASRHCFARRDLHIRLTIRNHSSVPQGHRIKPKALCDGGFAPDITLEPCKSFERRLPLTNAHKHLLVNASIRRKCLYSFEPCPVYDFNWLQCNALLKDGHVVEPCRFTANLLTRSYSYNVVKEVLSLFCHGLIFY